MPTLPNKLSPLMAFILGVLGFKVGDVLYRFTKAITIDGVGVTKFLGSEFANLSTLVLLVAVIILIKKQNQGPAA